MGMVESVVIQASETAEEGTPSFNLDSSQTSFRSSLLSEAESYNSESINSDKLNRALGSPIKTNDLKRSMRQSQTQFGNYIPDQKKILQKQVKQSMMKNNGFEKIISTPETADRIL